MTLQRTILSSILLSICFFLGGGVLPAQSRIFYVSTTGSDSNPGDIALPWRTIQKAADSLVAGDTVYIRTGTYSGRVIPRNSGANSTRRITYASYPGEKPALDGTGVAVPDDEGLFHIQGKRFITVTGLSVTNSAFAGIYVFRSNYITVARNRTFRTVSSGIGVWNSTDVVVEENDVSRACSGGMQESISVAHTRRFDVSNNHVHHVANSEKEGICLKDASMYGKVHGNKVHHVTAVGIYVDAWVHRTGNIDIYGNVVHHVTNSSGIQVSSEMGGLAENIRIYNNVVYRCKYFGIAVADAGLPDRHHPTRNVEIVNNTVWGNGIPWGGAISCYNADARNVLIRNNLCCRNSAFQIAVASNMAAQSVTVDHNLIYPFLGYEDEVRGTDFVQADPLLAAPGNGNFRLRSGSPAVDAGSSVKAPLFDFDGATRPQDGDHDGGEDFDIGAFETPATGESE